MRIRHARVHEQGLEPHDSLYVHMVCDHGEHPHTVDILPLEELRQAHQEAHERHELDASLRRSVERFLSCWHDGDQLRIANALSDLRAAASQQAPVRRPSRTIHAVE